MPSQIADASCAGSSISKMPLISLRRHSTSSASSTQSPEAASSGVTASAMQETRAAVEDAGGKAEIVVGDVRDLDAIRRIIARAADTAGST